MLSVKTSLHWERENARCQHLSDVQSLTSCDGVVDTEAAQHFINVTGMEESISSHHHLEGLWVRRWEADMSRQQLKITFKLGYSHTLTPYYLNMESLTTTVSLWLWLLLWHAFSDRRQFGAGKTWTVDIQYNDVPMKPIPQTQHTYCIVTSLQWGIWCPL